MTEICCTEVSKLKIDWALTLGGMLQEDPDRNEVKGEKKKLKGINKSHAKEERILIVYPYKILIEFFSIFTSFLWHICSLLWKRKKKYGNKAQNKKHRETQYDILMPL